MKAQKAPMKAAPKKGAQTSLLGKVAAAFKGAGKKAEPAVKAPTKAAAKPAAGKAKAAPGKSAAKPAPIAKAAPAVKSAPVAKTASAVKSAPAAKSAAAKTSAVPVKGNGKNAKVASTGATAKTAGKKSSPTHDSAGNEVCREVACEGLATSGAYCRLHYIKNWKKIKRKELILREKKLNQYIEELVAKYPDKYIEAIRSDLASDKDFSKVIQDLDLDESIDDFDVEGESLESVIDNIKRDFEDEGEGF